MNATLRISILVCTTGLLFAGCGNQPLVSPTQAAAVSLPSQLSVAAGGSSSRPIQARCETAFAPAPAPEACAVFQPVPSAYITITGQCQTSHLGRTTFVATQQLVFALDATGSPIIINGQPIITSLLNCGVLTAADGDELHHTTQGTVAPGASPGSVGYEGTLTFVGGNGRFAGAEGQAAFRGSASLITNTGDLLIDGSIAY